MKAMVYHNYGSPDVLRLEEVPKPTPGDDEVLVKVYAGSLNAGDWHTLRGDPFFIRLMGGVFKPRERILGDDASGRVEAVGKNVKQFKAGDEVFGICYFGAFAEYVCFPKIDWLALKPPRISFEASSAVPIAAITALQSLRSGRGIQPGQKVLINGASGGVGTFAIQIAKLYGAEVTAVCSKRKMDKVRELGADKAIDYGSEDFTKSGKRYDMILAVGGYHPIAAYRRALKPEGVYVCVGGSAAQYFQALFLGPLLSRLASKKMGVVIPAPNQEDLVSLIELVQDGKVVPVIDKCYPLAELPDALRYLEEGHAFGKVVISMERRSINEESSRQV